MKSRITLLLILFTSLMYGQFNTLFDHNQTFETVFEIAYPECNNKPLAAGIEFTTNNDANQDRISINLYNPNNGVVDAITDFYPSSSPSHFNILENLEVLSLKNQNNQCVGYLVAASIQENLGGDFNLHLLRLDQTGSLLWVVNPFPSNMASEQVHAMIQNASGDIVFTGVMNNGATENLLVFDMSITGVVGSAFTYRLDGNQDGVEGFSTGKDIIEVSGTGTAAKYLITGRGENHPFIIALDNSYGLVDDRFYDLDLNPDTYEEPVDIEFNGAHIWVAGTRVENDGFGNNVRSTFVLQVNGVAGIVPFLDFNLVKAYNLPEEGNYPTDAVLSPSNNSLVICGFANVMDNNSPTFDGDAFVMEVQSDASVDWISYHNYPNHDAGFWDIDITSNGYYLGGMNWDDVLNVKLDMQITAIGFNGEGKEECYEPAEGEAYNLEHQDYFVEPLQNEESFSPISPDLKLSTEDIQQENCNAVTDFVITGFKFEDKNCNGIYDAGTDPKVPNWPIFVTQGGPIWNGVTDALGNYSITLPAGTYDVDEGAVFGWQQSFPITGNHTVTINNGNPIANAIFGNKNAESCDCVETFFTQTAECCLSVQIDNNFGLFYDEIEIESNSGVFFNTIQAPGWTLVNVSPSLIRLIPAPGPQIPMGNSQVVDFCMDEYMNDPLITVRWKQGGDVYCFDDYLMNCPCDEEDQLVYFDITKEVQEDQTDDFFDAASDIKQDPQFDLVITGVTTSALGKLLPYIGKSDITGNTIIAPIEYEVPGANMVFDDAGVQVEICYIGGSFFGYAVLSNWTLGGSEIVHYALFDKDLNKICDYQMKGIFSDFEQKGDDFYIIGTNALNELSIHKLYALTCTNAGPVSTTYYSNRTYPNIGIGKAITNLSNGNLAITGNKSFGDIWYAHIDPLLQLVTVGGGVNYLELDVASQNLQDEVIDIEQDATGRIYIAGTSGDKYFIVIGLEDFGTMSHDWLLLNGSTDFQTLHDVEYREIDENLIIHGTKVDPVNDLDRSQIVVLDQNLVPISSVVYLNPGYEASFASRLDICSDGGFALAHSERTGNCAGLGCIEHLASKITKTGYYGYLQDCECYKPSPIEVSQGPQSVLLSIESVPLGGILIGDLANFTCQDVVHDSLICTIGWGEPAVCEISSSIRDTMNADSCCSILSYDNLGSGIYKIQVDVIAPASASLAYWSVFPGYQVVPSSVTSTSLIVEKISGGMLPTSGIEDYIMVCLRDTVGSSSQNLKISYLDQFCNPVPDCMDVLETECQADTMSDDCYALNIDTIYCDSLNNQFVMCFTVTNFGITPTMDAIQLSASITELITPNYITFPPLVPNATTAQICVQIIDFSGLPKPRKMNFTHYGYKSAGNGLEKCCVDSDPECVILPNCCDPCDTAWVVVSPDSLYADSCCYELDITNTCPDLLKKVKMESLTPGVAIGTVFLGGPTAANWGISNLSSCPLVSYQSAPFAPVGFYDDLIHFCLDDTNSVPTQIQEVAIHYIGLDAFGNDTILCSDTLEFECAIDEGCLEVVSDSVYCDSTGAFYLDFCIKNVSNTPMFTATNLIITAPILSVPAGMFINPSIFNGLSIPPQGIYCDKVRIFRSGAQNPQAGDKLNLEFILHNNANVDTCCIESELLCVIIPPCCDPCETDFVELAVDTMYMDSCCHALDVIADCPNSLKSIELECITPGVNIGSVYLGGPFAASWNLTNLPTNPLVSWSSAGYAPVGVYSDLIHFCLDDTNAVTTLSQEVIVRYIGFSTNGPDTVLCMDTLHFECETPDLRCAEIVKDTVFCDSLGNYYWAFGVKNISTPSFTADRIVFSTVLPNTYGLSISPSIFNNISLPPDSMYCDTVRIFGPGPSFDPQVFDQLKLEVVIHNTIIDTCCIESELVCLTIPPCSDCCEDFEGFCSDINFNSSIYGICDTAVVHVCFGDTCTYTDIDWGDGHTETHQGQHTSQHFYTVPGSYVVCATFKESSDGGATFCWEKTVCDTIVIDPCTPFYEGGCCDSMVIYGDEQDNFVNRIKHYNGNTYILTRSRKAGTNEYTRPSFSKFDASHKLVWQRELDENAQYFDFVKTSIDHFLIVGRTEPARDSLGQNQDNSSILLKIRDDGSIAFTDVYDNYGREGFLKIIKHKNPLNPLYPYYISAIENQDGFLGTSWDEFHLYNLDDNGNFNWGREYTFNYGGGPTISIDDQWSSITDLANGHILIQGDYHPWRRGVLVEVNGLDGTHIRPPVHSNLNMRYFNARETTTGEFVVIGSYTDGNHQNRSGAILLMDTAFNVLSSVEFQNQGISDLREMEHAGNDIYFTTGRDRDGIPMIVRFRVVSGNTLVVDDIKYYWDQETAYSDAHIYAEPSLNQMYYLDARKGNPESLGGYDVLWTSYELNLLDSCLIDTIIPYRSNFLQHSAQIGTDTDYILPNPDSFPSVFPSFVDTFVCSDPFVDCDSLDWSGFDMVIDTICDTLGQFPDIKWTPTFGATVADWVEYDLACNSTIELVQFGPVFQGWIQTGITNPNLFMCVHAYKVVNGDTCMTTLIRDFTIENICDSLDAIEVIDISEDIQVFPNPFTAEFSVRILSDLNIESFVLRDIQGVSHKTWNELDFQDQYSFDLSELVPGIYILEVTAENGQIGQKKIIKIE